MRMSLSAAAAAAHSHRAQRVAAGRQSSRQTLTLRVSAASFYRGGHDITIEMH